MSLLGQACLLLSGSLVARSLGVEARGEFAALCLFPMIVGAIGSMGVPSAVTFHLGGARRSAAETISLGYRIAVVQAFVLTPCAGLALAFWIRSIDGHLDWPIVFAAAVVLPQLTHQIGIGALQGLHRFRAQGVLRLLPVAMYATAVAALWGLDRARISSLIIAWLLSFVVSAIATAAVTVRLTPSTGGPVPAARELIGFGLRGQLASVSPIDGYALDQLILSLTASPRELGLYVAARSFANLPRLVSQGVSIIVFPFVASSSRESATRVVWKAFEIIAIASGAFVVALAPFLPWATVAFFGDEFAPAAGIAVMLVMAAAMASTRQMLFDGLRGLGRPGRATMIEVASVTLLVGLALWWIPAADGIGLARAIAVTAAASLLAAVVVFRHASLAGPSSLAIDPSPERP